MHITKNKIAIISHSLGIGGAERFAGLLSFILENLGYEIHNIVINNNVDYEYAGTLYNLGEICVGETIFTRKAQKSFLLNQYLKAHKIEIIIDNRSRNSVVREIIYKWIYKGKDVFYMIHNYKLKMYLPENKLMADFIYGNAKKIVCVSKAIEDEIIRKYNFKNTITQYNPVDFSKIKSDDSVATPDKYILFFGRLEEQSKNFSLMLDAFLISKIYESGYKLIIMGNGDDLDFITAQIQKLNLQEHVTIIPFQKNPFAYVKNARFTVLTSRYEGFPMSIIESLALGTPVIAVDCNSGPAEIIVNESNGLLVKNNDAVIFANAMKRFVEDDSLYKICKLNASKSLGHLSVENISKKWQQILM